MNQCIFFKNIDGKVTIIANQNIGFDVFLNELEKRLEKLYIKDDLLKSNITLDIKNIELDSKRILNIFDVFSSYSSI